MTADTRPWVIGKKISWQLETPSQTLQVRMQGKIVDDNLNVLKFQQSLASILMYIFFQTSLYTSESREIIGLKAILMHEETKMDFNKWHNGVADVPVRDANGNWYDLETGLFFDSVTAERAAQEAALAKAVEARQVAKAIGGKALEGGTSKQKKWAEELRAGVVQNLTPDSAQKVLKQFQFRNTKWWIDNRDTFSFVETVFGKKRTSFLGPKQTEAAFEKHFDRPRIAAFQKPLCEVFERFEKRYERCKGHMIDNRRILVSDRVLVEDCRKVLSSDSTEMDVFADLMDRLLPRLEARSR